jgi:hypothetical protein
MKDIDMEPIVSIHTSTLVGKEEEETEMFTNKASEDIARELGEGYYETQALKMSFDESGEKTEL